MTCRHDFSNVPTTTPTTVPTAPRFLDDRDDRIAGLLSFSVDHCCCGFYELYVFMSLHDGIELEHNCGSVFMQFSLFTNGLDFFNKALTF